MDISVTDAKSQLTELVRRAQAGEEIVLTRHGHPAARITPVVAKVSAAKRRALLREVRARAAANVMEGPAAERSQDFLYDEDGLPR